LELDPNMSHALYRLSVSNHHAVPRDAALAEELGLGFSAKGTVEHKQPCKQRFM